MPDRMKMEKRAIHNEMSYARHALVEARGQLVEADRVERLDRVVGCLRKAAEHIERAIAACAAAKRDA
jgi:hypothetical protein